MAIQPGCCLLLIDQHIHAAPHIQTQHTPLGTWWFSEDPTALWAIATQHLATPSSRMVFSQNHTLTAHHPWRGPAIEAIHQMSLQVPAGMLVMDEPLYLQLHTLGHIQHASRQATWGETKVRWIQNEDEDALERIDAYMRTNIRWHGQACHGRQATLARLEQATTKTISVDGITGCGKTHIVRHWLTQKLIKDNRTRAWWVSLSGCRTIMEVATKLAQIWPIELSNDPKQDALHIAKHADAMGRYGWMVLDGLDSASDEAIDWLQDTLAHTSLTNWVMIRCKPHTWPNATSISIPPLDTLAACHILTAALPHIKAATMQSCIDIAELCKGHALSLVLIARGLSTHPTQDNLRQKLQEQPVTTALLQTNWQHLTQAQRTALLCLCHFTDGFEASLASLAIANALEISSQAATATLQSLHQKAWLFSLLNRQGWSIPESFRSFVFEQCTDETHQHTSRHFNHAILETTQRWIDERLSDKEPHVMQQGIDYAADVLGVMTHHHKQKNKDVIDVLIELRHIYNMNDNELRHIQLVTDFLALAQAQGWSDEVYKLKAALGLIWSKTYGRSQQGHDMLLALWPERQRLPTHTQAAMAHQLAENIHDLPTLQDKISPVDYCQIGYALCTQHHHPDVASQLGTLMTELVPGEDALAWAKKAQAHAEETQAPSYISRASFGLHRGLIAANQLQQSKAMAKRAYETSQDLMLPQLTTKTLAGLGYICLMLDELPQAKHYLNEGLIICQRHVLKFAEANLNFILGMVYLCDDNAQMARLFFKKAKDIYAESEVVTFTHVCDLWIATCLIFTGQIQTGEGMFDDVTTYLKANDSEHYIPTLNMLSLIPKLHRAGMAASEDNIKALQKEAHAMMTPHLLIERRVVDLAIAHAQQRAQEPEAQILEILTPSKAFRLNEGEWVNISRRKAIRSIFTTLVDNHLADQPQIISAQDLFEAGWPNETPEVRSGMMRLYVAISTLRKLGLQDIIETIDHGYRLTTHLTIQKLSTKPS